jgi:hypothetical protein
MLGFAHHTTSAKLDEIPTLPDRRWHYSPCRSCNHRLVGQAVGHLCAIRNSRNSSGAGLALIYGHLPAPGYPASAIQSLLAVGLRIPQRGGVWTCQNRRTHSSLCSRIKFFRVRICPRRRGVFRRWLWTVRLAVGAVPPRRALPRFHRSENGGCLCGVVLLHRDHTDSHLSIPTGN